jgi:hypothetical protein
LYQDAWNYAHSGNTVRLGSFCTPAHLSASPDFERNEPELRWLQIARKTITDPSAVIETEGEQDMSAPERG